MLITFDRARRKSAIVAAALLAACGGGTGGNSGGTPGATGAANCTAQAAVALNSTGGPFDLGAGDRIVEIIGYSAPATISYKNVTTHGRFCTKLYTLLPNGSCVSASDTYCSSAPGASQSLYDPATSSNYRVFVHLTGMPNEPRARLELCGVSGNRPGHDCDQNNVTLYGSVIDNLQRPIPGATVSIVNNGFVYSQLTDGNGNYVLKTPVATLPPTFAYAISKSGATSYVPVAFGTAKGATTYIAAGTDAVLKEPGDIYTVVEVEPIVHHLGDDNYGGDINSQFQLGAQGTTFAKSFTVNPGSLAYGRATITLLVKGSQLANTIEVNGKSVGVLPVSPADGSFGAVIATVDTVSFFVAGTNTVVLRSARNAANTDYDDFEFVNIIVRFHV